MERRSRADEASNQALVTYNNPFVRGMNSRTQEILNYMADLFRQGITVENLDPREAEELVRALKNSGIS